MTDGFAVQDEITQQVVAAIEPSLRTAEIARAKSKPTESLNAYDLYLRSLPEIYAYTEQGFSRAVALLLEAVARDPNYAEAWAMLADCIARQINAAWVKDAEEALVQNRQAALRAVQADPENGLVLSIAAFSLRLYSGQLDRAMELCEQALSLQPNSAAVLTSCGSVLIFNDEADRASTQSQNRPASKSARSARLYHLVGDRGGELL